MTKDVGEKGTKWTLFYLCHRERIWNKHFEMLRYLEQLTTGHVTLELFLPFWDFLKASLCLKKRIGSTQEVNNFSSKWFSNISFSHSSPVKNKYLWWIWKGIFQFFLLLMKFNWHAWGRGSSIKTWFVEYSLALEEFKGIEGALEWLITVSNGIK